MEKEFEVLHIDENYDCIVISCSNTLFYDTIEKYNKNPLEYGINANLNVSQCIDISEHDFFDLTENLEVLNDIIANGSLLVKVCGKNSFILTDESKISIITNFSTIK